MPSFLEHAARHVFTTYRERLDKITVILPTHRAAYFFRRTLAMQTEEPVWAPRIVAIDDFITEAADVQLVDPIGLIWMLYDVCKEIDPNVQFDRFTGWAHTLLLDFDKIDQYLINAEDLFDYLSEAKTLERWQPDLGPSRQGSAKSKIIENYFLLWQNLHKIYLSLKDRLQEGRKAYRGMMYRYIAEHPEGLLDNEEVEKYVFVGLNALSASEEKLLRRLVKEKKAEALWDTDAYYMEKNKGVKAGDVLRNYKNDGRFGPWNWQFDDLLTQPKDIHLIGVPNAAMQGKVAMQLHRQQQLEFTSPVGDEDYGLDDLTAIVLPDENLLMPVLESLDDHVKEFNITMGLSLRQSNLFTLVDALFALQAFTLSESSGGRKRTKLNHRHIVKVLTHPFIHQYEYLLFLKAKSEAENEETKVTNPVRKALFHIGRQNVIFIAPQELIEIGEHTELFKALFTPWEGDPHQALQCFRRLIDLLREVYQERKDAIEMEYLYLFSLIVKRLHGILEERKAKPVAEKLSLRSFKLFLYELFRQTKIPFSGEPVSRLQIMGMLETRTLDYDTLIILSANEKTLPQAKKQHSLIPLDACQQFGLPTYRSQEATMSYHFYRLLQRARKVYLLYVSSDDTYGSGEKSRFIHQIEHELVRYNPNISLHHQQAQVRERSSLEVLLSPQIAKTEVVQAQLRALFENGLYPSQVNMFVNCSLQFYFNAVAGIRAEEEVEENMGPGAFGDLVHKTLENLDKELSDGRPAVTAEDLKGIIPTLPERVRKEFLQYYPGHGLEHGMNHLMYKIAVRVITNFLERLIEDNVFPMEILGLERKLNTTFTAQIAGQPVPVTVAGKIDRIDRIGDTIRVIDYKTGKIERKHLKSGGGNTYELIMNDPEADKVRQLWMYKYILAKRMLQDKGIQLADRLIHAENHKLIAGFYSFRNMDAGLLENPLELGDGLSLESFVAQSEIYLQEMVNKMLSTTEPFRQTERLEICVNCSYKGICGR